MRVAVGFPRMTEGFGHTFCMKKKNIYYNILGSRTISVILVNIHACYRTKSFIDRQVENTGAPVLILMKSNG